MTSDQPVKGSANPSKTSLRELAKQCGVPHTTLSKAVHARRLVAGVRIDDRGRVAVVDAAAAVAEWNSLHVPQLPELLRRERSHNKTARQPSNAGVLPPHQDHDDDRSWNARDILAFCLVEAALAGEASRAFVGRITARLRDAVTRSYADDVMATDASSLLLDLVSDAIEAAAVQEDEP